MTKFPDGTAISSLSRLNLRRNQIEDSTILDWLQTGAFVPVKHLNLGWNKIGNAGAAALAKSPMLSGLEQLMLDSNSIANEGANAIAKSKNLESLKVLELHDNNYDQSAAKALMDLRIRILIKKHLKGTELNLNGQRLENRGLKALGAIGIVIRNRNSVIEK